MATWEQLPDNLLQDVFQACLRPSILEQVGNASGFLRSQKLDAGSRAAPE
jgi:hypothetical protein